MIDTINDTFEIEEEETIDYKPSFDLETRKEILRGLGDEDDEVADKATEEIDAEADDIELSPFSEFIAEKAHAKAVGSGTKRVKSRKSSDEFVAPKVDPVPIDPKLSTNDMISLIYAEIVRKKIAGHHISSMNTFNKIGIKEIITKVFSIDIEHMKNNRTETAEDKSINEISVKVIFTDVKLSAPSIVSYETGKKMLTLSELRAQIIYDIFGRFIYFGRYRGNRVSS